MRRVEDFHRRGQTLTELADDSALSSILHGAKRPGRIAFRGRGLHFLRANYVTLRGASEVAERITRDQRKALACPGPENLYLIGRNDEKGVDTVPELTLGACDDDLIAFSGFAQFTKESVPVARENYIATLAQAPRTRHMPDSPRKRKVTGSLKYNRGQVNPANLHTAHETTFGMIRGKPALPG